MSSGIFFTAKESYFNYTLKADGFWRDKQLEDINLLFSVDYFTKLLRMGSKWSQRNFIKRQYQSPGQKIFR
jgi:hypothetical protein